MYTFLNIIDKMLTKLCGFKTQIGPNLLGKSALLAQITKNSPIFVGLLLN
jgi:hypothetical protein